MREPIVSRTFRGLVVKALILNLDTREQTEREFYLERLPKSARKVDAFIRQRIESELTETEKFVTVLSRREELRRYYLTEIEFIQKAKRTNLLPGAADKESEDKDE